MMQEPARRTVGDTLTIIQHVRTVPGAVVQPRMLIDSSLVTLLSPPSMTRDGANVRIAYRVAVWQPGSNDLILPGPVVVTPDGRVDTIADYHVQLQVATVLPSGKVATTIAPKGARPVIPRGDRTVIPFLLLLGLLAGAIALARWWLRRRGPEPVPPSVLPAAPLDAEKLERWLAAGEAHLALRHVEALLRDRPELAEWRARAAAARYAAGGDAELAALVREGWAHCR
jgi:hypothetical protein